MQPGASYSSGDRRCLQNAMCFSYFTSDDLEYFLQAVCVDNEGNIAPPIDQLPGESKTKKNDSRNTLTV